MSQGFWCWFKLESDLTCKHLNRWLADCPETPGRLEILESDSLPQGWVNQLDHQKNSPVMDAAFLGRSLIAPWHPSLVFRTSICNSSVFWKSSKDDLDAHFRFQLGKISWDLFVGEGASTLWSGVIFVAGFVVRNLQCFFRWTFFLVPIWWQIMIQNQRNIQRCKVFLCIFPHIWYVYIYIYYMMYIDVWYIRCICVCYMKYMIHIIFSTISFRNVTGGCGLHVDMTGRQVWEVKELVEHAADVSRKNADPGERSKTVSPLVGFFRGTNRWPTKDSTWFNNQSRIG